MFREEIQSVDIDRAMQLSFDALGDLVSMHESALAQEALGNWLQNACLKYQTTDLGRGMAEDVGDVGHVRLLATFVFLPWLTVGLSFATYTRGLASPVSTDALAG
jgi:hypothetical protein